MFYFTIKEKDNDTIYHAVPLDNSEVSIHWQEDGESLSVIYPAKEVEIYLKNDVWSKVYVF